MGIETRNNAMVRLGRQRRHLQQIRANGSFYVADCQPWAIKKGCQRFDCPMRYLAIAPEATENDYILNCFPTGDLADTLILLQRTLPINI